MIRLKKITLAAVLVIFLGLSAAVSLTSCGKQGSDKDEAGTEHPQEESEEKAKDEHPTEEHPAESDSTAEGDSTAVE